ncbi:MAG: DNA mismatch repair endonuclease MutL [Clostridia bacterium]|nr:DNA mismatch repair endonuclease MutL [Clostridia bacterium]MBN2882631.1 DNA mismatch repair endonuclease MutL [Clostridia bacterium]
MMMNRIVILDENTSNQIAAGEVIERPASIVKEMVENSIDAGACNISIEITKGGISLIRVSDDGSGIYADDVEMAFERHGTSKIRKADDLKTVATMGFRGEALPSIASVSRLEMDTRTQEAESGVKIKVTGGDIVSKVTSNRQPGTTITVRDLFYNVPARYKFLKNDQTETRYCTDIVTRIALAHPEISFTYSANKTEILRTPGDKSLQSAIYCAYGREIMSNLFPVDYRDSLCRITGYTGNRFAARGNRQNQTILVNGRYIKDATITKAVEKAYETEIMKGKFPFYVLNLEIDAGQVDVNVHPAKTEVRFQRGNEIFNSFYSAVRAAIDTSRGITPAEAGAAKIRRTEPAREEPVVVKSTFFDNETKKIERKPMPAEVHEALVNARRQFYDGAADVNSNFLEVSEEYKVVKETSGMGHIRVLENARIAGVLFNTFILLEYTDEEMLVIDQHAAHERITYEGLLKKRKERNMDSQKLMVPIRVRLDRKDAVLVEENRSMIEGLGFDFDLLGPDEAVIRALPVEIFGENVGEVFLGLVDSLEGSGKQDADIIEKEAIYQMACKNSVKANTALSDIEINALLSQLKGLENPYTCPHGRPVILTLTRRGLEKIFKRIV